MAYLKYSACVYRNDEHIEERSDAVILVDGVVCNSIDRIALSSGHSLRYHGILGDDIYICLYEKNWSSVYKKRKNILQEVIRECNKKYPGATKHHMMIDRSYFINRDLILSVEFERHLIEICWLKTYVYARLIQPDGVVWTACAGWLDNPITPKDEAIEIGKSHWKEWDAQNK